MDAKKTLVLGASTNPSRYSNMAVLKLLKHGHKVVPVGIKKGKVGGIEILSTEDKTSGIETVTLYLGPKKSTTVLQLHTRFKTKPGYFQSWND